MEEIKQRYKQTDIGMIPEDWEVKPICNGIADVKSGKRLPLGYYVSDTKSPHPYIRVIDMIVGGIDTKDIKYLPNEAFSAISNYRIFVDDIFISVAGTLGIVGKIPAELNGANLTENANRLTKITCNRDYLMYYLLSPLIQNVITSEQTVGAQPKLALNRIRNFQIGLPSTIVEQTAIATALSDTDAIIAVLDKKIAKKQQIKQGAMQQLLTGKKRLPGFSGEWVKKKIIEIGKVVTGSTPSRSNLNLWNGDFLWVSAQDFKSKYIIDSVEKITENGKNRCRILPLNSVLVTCIASIGLNALSKVACATNQQINSVVCNSDNEPEFLYYQISNNVENLKMIAGQTAVPIINKGQFESFTLMFPNSKTEQTAIAQILTDMDNEIAHLEKERNKYKELKAGMMQVLLTGKVRLV